MNFSIRAISRLILPVLPLAAADDSREVPRRSVERNLPKGGAGAQLPLLGTAGDSRPDSSGAVKHRDSKT
jgi:hypothetical protein